MTNKKLIAKLNKLDSHAEIVVVVQGVECKIIDAVNDIIVAQPKEMPTIDLFKRQRKWFEKYGYEKAKELSSVTGVPKRLMGENYLKRMKLDKKTEEQFRKEYEQNPLPEIKDNE